MIPPPPLNQPARVLWRLRAPYDSQKLDGLIAEMSLKGYDMPIAVVHWVMAANRQISLGEKIGISNEKVFKYLIMSRKRGFGQKGFNQALLMTRMLKRGWMQAQDRINQTIQDCPNLLKKSSPLAR